jgi:hypothetical protein
MIVFRAVMDVGVAVVYMEKMLRKSVIDRTVVFTVADTVY